MNNSYRGSNIKRNEQEREYQHLPLRVKCRDCLGCNKLELKEFDGEFRCDNFRIYKGVSIKEI
jgi:hypothetical protein